MTTETINGMTIKRADTLWASEPISITYRRRWFTVSVWSESDDEYALWGYEVEQVNGPIMDSDGAEFDSGTTALQAAQAAIRQAVDDQLDTPW